MNTLHSRSPKSFLRWLVVVAPVLLLATGFGLARAQEAAAPSVGPGPSTCFEGSSATPYVQPVVFAPSPAYYVKAYPTAAGTMDVRVSNGSHEVPVFTGYVVAFEADYVASAHSTLFLATVSDSKCGPISNVYVRAGQVDDGATTVKHPWTYRSPHATGTFHRDICGSGATQTIIIMEGNHPAVPTNAPYVPGQGSGSGGAVNYGANMQCPTYRWTAAGGFVSSGLQSCGSCDDLDGASCTDPCFRTPGVMRAGQCDLNAATPLCNSAAGQVCSLAGATPTCLNL